MTHVLVTRPLEGSRELASQLDCHGFSPIVMPFYSFSALHPEVDSNTACPDRTKRCLAVFTSPRAVQFGLPLIPTQDINFLEFAAVGATTATKLEANGHQVSVRADTGYTSEDLLKVSNLAENPGNAIIFCAPGGRQALTRGLTRLGWGVTSARVYERVPLRPSTGNVELLNNAGKLISVWTSISALELARESLPGASWQKILNAPALVISARIQHHLQQLGATNIELADGPRNADLLCSILRLSE